MRSIPSQTSWMTVIFHFDNFLVMKEVGKEIKSYTELNGRTDSNLIDALNAMYNYDMTKAKLQHHMDSKELTLNPYKQGYLSDYQNAMNHKVSTKIEAIQ